MEEPGNSMGWDSDSQFFVCISCANPVLSFENLLLEDVALNAIVCRNPLNVWVPAMGPIRRLYRHQVVKVNCNGINCHRTLGWKFVRVRSPNIVIQEGRFILHRSSLLYWDGRDILQADTLPPFWY